MYFNCLASDLTPFYIANNLFQGSTSYYRVGLFTNKVSGDFKNNLFTSDQYDHAATLYQSDMNFFGNTLLSDWGINVSIYSSSSINQQPMKYDDDYYWYGGSNIMETDYPENIEFDEGSDVFVDNGNNCFTVSESEIQIAGLVDGICATQRNFPARKNFWSPYPPGSYIMCNDTVVNLIYPPYLNSCPETLPEADDYELIEKGNEIVDSLIISATGGGGGQSGNGLMPSENLDEELYTQSILSRNHREYDKAIEHLQDLLDLHDTSKYIKSSLTELYLNYTLKDTSFTQSAVTELFTELKSYLGSKIEQYESNYSFIQKAYSYYLMCLTKTLDYNEAILGYENIMQNHPDTTRRLLASWDRSAVVLLQQGSGGGDKEELTQDQKLEKLFEDKPIHLLAKNAFKNIPVNSIPRQFKYDRSSIRRLESRITRFNPRSRDELDSKIGEDLEVILEIQTSKNNPIKNVIPSEFVLQQNYPNPFNPATTISFEIPKDNFVELKVYDITGREVMLLVSEVKTAGKYDIEMNGANLPSGIYFYKLTAGDFVATRKMILVK